MSSTKNNSNLADIANDVVFDSALDENKVFENEVKDKFIKFKSKNVIFFKEGRKLPQFPSLQENNKNNSLNLEGFPKIKCKLLNELPTDSLQPSIISSVGCENKKPSSCLFRK